MYDILVNVSYVYWNIGILRDGKCMWGVGLCGCGVDIDLFVKVGYDERWFEGIDVGDEWDVEGDDEGLRE